MLTGNTKESEIMKTEKMSYNQLVEFLFNYFDFNAD